MRRILAYILVLSCTLTGCGRHIRLPRLAKGLIVATDTLSPGLERCARAEWSVLHRSEGYVNNAVMTRFKRRYYCMWQETPVKYLRNPIPDCSHLHDGRSRRK